MIHLTTITTGLKEEILEAVGFMDEEQEEDIEEAPQKGFMAMEEESV